MRSLSSSWTLAVVVTAAAIVTGLVVWSRYEPDAATRAARFLALLCVPTAVLVGLVYGLIRLAARRRDLAPP